MKKPFDDFESNLDNEEDFPIINKDLKPLLQTWQAPTITSNLDTKVLTAFRQQNKQTIFQKLWNHSIKVPLPIAASLTVLFFTLSWFSIYNQSTSSKIGSDIGLISVENSKKFDEAVTLNQQKADEQVNVNPVYLSSSSLDSYTNSKKVRRYTINKKLFSLKTSISLTKKQATQSKKLFGLESNYLLATNFEKKLNSLQINYLDQQLELNELSLIHKANSKNHLSISPSKNTCGSYITPIKEPFKYSEIVPGINKKTFHLKMLSDSDLK